MTSEWDEQAVFLAALDLPAEQREAYLDRACPDEACRSRIQSLLEHHEAVTEQLLSALPARTRQTDASSLQRIDEFQVIRKIGEGGMGVVYLAEDLILGRRVALKVLATWLSGSEDALARFRTEARATAAIQHPAIVPVYKFGHEGDVHYIASEYVDGATLAELIVTERGHRTGKSGVTTLRLWCRQAAALIADVADGLDAAHRVQVLHRDVKPSNILIDRDKHPRLTDFGIAKFLTEENRTDETRAMGTVHYMSPEQASIAKAEVDQRSDVFSLGVVLYELLSLRRPFEGGSQNEILRAVAEREAPRLRTIDSGIPRDLEVICHRALEKRPNDRYQSAAHVAADLRCYLEDRPILAVPPSAFRRCRLWTRAHRRSLAVVSSLVLVLGTVGAIAFASYREAERWREVRCAVQLEKVGEGTRIYQRLFDPNSFEVGPRAVVRRDRDETVWLLPGEYRFEFLTTDGRFAEADVLLEDAGESRTFTPTYVDEKKATASMVLVPTGSLKFGGDKSLGPQREVLLDGFWIDRYEVTNEQYSDFLTETGRERTVGWSASWPPAELAKLPAAGLTWDDMEACCRWYGKRLPTLLEWERAARYPDNRIYPGGDVPPTGLPQLSEDQRIAVNQGDLANAKRVYAQLSRPVDSDTNVSALGMYYVFGNVSEMTSSIAVTARTRTVYIKGGSWMVSPQAWDLTRIQGFPLGYGAMDLGFRCARSAALNMNEKLGGP